MIRSKLFIKNQRGFTLIEAMVAVTIFAVLMTLVLSFYVQSWAASKKGTKEIEMLDSLSYALSVVAKDIREAEEVENGSGNEQLNLRLSDGMVVKYRLDNNDFIKEVDNDSQVLSNNVKNVEFIYYDDKDEVDLSSQNDLSKVKRVKVIITADDGEDENSPLDVNPVVFETSALIRVKG